MDEKMQEENIPVPLAMGKATLSLNEASAGDAF